MPFAALLWIVVFTLLSTLGCTDGNGGGESLGVARQALAPSISGFSPSSAAVGANVVISGTGFTGVTGVTFGSSADATSGSSATFAVNNDGQITAVVPVSARNGSIVVLHPDGVSMSTPTFQVVSSGMPTITSFDPTSAGVGNFTRISGTNFAGTTAVSFGGVQSNAFYIESQTTIAAYVPDGATSSPISVTNSVGTVTSSQPFTVLPKPTITSIAPSAGVPGSSVVLTGTGLSGTTEVRFGADGFAAATAAFTVDSSTQITATVPSGFSTGPIRIQAPGGVAYSPPFTPLSSQLPVVTSFTPTSGGRDTEVQISGSGFTGTTAVTFAGAPAGFELESDTSLRAFVPQGATSGPIAVTNSLGTGASSQPFDVIPPPTLTGLSPVSGAPGATVVLTGTSFTGATSVTFGASDSQDPTLPSGSASSPGVDAVFTVNGPTQITATVPSGASSGPIAVRTPSGQAVSVQSFTVLSAAAPDVTGFAPQSGGVGADVTIDGTGFTGTTAVRFAGTAAAFTLLSDIQIRARVPSGAQSGLITVVNTLGSDSSSQPFTVVPPPAITSVTPATGAPGASIVLSGSGFTGAFAVRFGGGDVKEPLPSGDGGASSGEGGGASTGGASFTVNDDGRITVIVPLGATSGPITVEATGGSAESPVSFTVLSATPPNVTSVSPSSGGERSPVRIYGSGFTGTTGVSFAGTPATSYWLVSDGEISTSVPPGATSGPLTVTNTLGSDSTGFTVLPPPVIAGFLPTSGLPGTSVVITGSGFTGATQVTFSSGTGFGGTASADPKPGTDDPVTGFAGPPGPTAVFTVSSDTQITATVPLGAVTGPIAVSTPSGDDVSATSFTVLSPAAPTLWAISPTSGGQGFVVSVFGTGFTGTTSVSFGGTQTTSFWLVGDTELEAVVPSGASTGPVTVTNGAGDATSTQSFTVIPPPTITSFTPAAGPAGTSVTITGTGFLGTEWVGLGGGKGATFTVVNDTTLVAAVPSGASSGNIEVHTRYGNARSAQTFVVQSSTQPTIGAFTPGSGLPGTRVEISGTGFTGVTDVEFVGSNPDSRTDFRAESDTLLVVWVPDGAVTGPVTVTNTLGSVTSTMSFVVLPPPVVTGFSPTSGTAGDRVTITGSGFSAVERVEFNGRWAPFDVVGDGQIVAWVPGGATTGPISVAGTETVQDFTVQSDSAPTLTSFSPGSGYPGQLTRIYGTGFTGTTGVTFAGMPASSFWVEWDGGLVAYVPEGAVTGPIAVTNTIGTATSTTPFQVVAPPTITSFSPTAGAPGTTVVITGTGLSSVSEVRFSDARASFTIDSGTQITAVVPPNAVTGPIGLDRDIRSSAPFVVLSASAPTVTGFSPGTGGTDAPIVVTGTGFAGAVAVTFGGVPAAFEIASDTQLVALVPFGATTGPIAVTNNVGTGASTGSFGVTAAPTITGLSPGTGSEGDSVVITGTGFTGATEVRFGIIEGLEASFTVSSATQITATVPPGATTGPVMVRSPAGTATSQVSFQVVARTAPSITGFSPGSGAVGALVKIQGSGFAGVTGVAFGGVAASLFSGEGPGSLFAVVPSGATTGRITVVNALGTATSSTDFQVLPGGLSITNVAPSAGSAGTVVTITGTGLAGAGALFSTWKQAPVVSSSDTRLVVTVPPGAVTGPVLVFQEGGPGDGPSAVARWPSFTVYAAFCTAVPAGTPCGLCATCSAAGTCTAPASDDAGCGVIECDGLDGPCGDRNDLASGRCEGIGDCKDPNSTDCTAGTFMPPGADCGTCAACNGSGLCASDTTQAATDCPPCQTCGSSLACVPVTNGTACSDGTACTAGETCQNGSCGPPTSVVTCTAQDACHDVGACDPTTGACSNPRKPDGTACSDGYGCTLGDSCSAGVCVFVSDQCPCTTSADCSPPSSCHEQGSCDPVTRTCTPVPKVNGTSCDDGNACTTGETCQTGTCGSPASTVTCTALDGCHDAGTCNPASGICTNPVEADGTACTDGFGCTTGDACQAGACVPALDACPCTTDADCNARDQCEQDGACDPLTRLCVRPSRPDGTPCDDSSACTSGETCQAGVCGSPAATVSCSALDDCHDAGTCDSGTGLCTNPAKADGVACDDGLSCTSSDHCESGACVLGADACDCTADADCVNGTQCQDPGTCNLTTRRCDYPDKPDGAPCSDADACTLGETCQAGICGSPTSTVDCVPGSSCLDVGTCVPTTGRCLYPGRADGTACSDGVDCTSGDACQAGACVPGADSCTCATSADCAPLDQCHEGGVCDPVTRLCSNPARPDGTPCDDADACTTGESCQAGACGAPASAVTCGAATECHTGPVCNRATGACDSTPLADGTACAGGACQSGSCAGSIADGGAGGASNAGGAGGTPVDGGAGGGAITNGGAGGAAGPDGGAAAGGTASAAGGSTAGDGGPMAGGAGSGAGGAGAGGVPSASGGATAAAGASPGAGGIAIPADGGAGDAAAAGTKEDGGCGCRTSGAPTSPRQVLALALVAAALGLRRRASPRQRPSTSTAHP